MNHFQKEDSFHRVMKENILETPSAQFEDIVMLQIKRQTVERKIKTNYLRSFILGIIGCLVGVSSSIWMSETKTILTDAFGNSVFLFSQTTLALAVLILIDFVINSLSRYNNISLTKLG